jgi:hypothetical protein
MLERKLASGKVGVGNRDKQIVVTSLLSHLITGFFGNPMEQLPYSVGAKLRASVSLQIIVNTLTNLRFKEKPVEAILGSLETFADNLLEVVVNPTVRKLQQDLLRTGKHIINILYSQIKCYFQQVSVIKSLYSQESDVLQRTSLFSMEFVKPMRQLLVATIEIFIRDATKEMVLPKAAFNFPEPMKCGKNKASQSQEIHWTHDTDFGSRANDQIQLQETRGQPLLFSSYLEHHKEAQDHQHSFELSTKSDKERETRETPDIEALMTGNFNINSLVDSLIRRGIKAHY